MEVTLNLFEHFLNDNPPAEDSEKWIIKGKHCAYFQRMGRYGSALRKYDLKLFKEEHEKFCKKLSDYEM